MFKSSSVIRLSHKDSDSYSMNNGKYTLKGEDENFVAPELTDVEKIQIIDFPTGTVSLDSNVNFCLHKNNVKGHIEVIVHCPSGRQTTIPIQYVDHDTVRVNIRPHDLGVYKIFVKCNQIPIPGSPFLILATAKKSVLPVFNSDASKVLVTGNGLQKISLHSCNEFLVDGSNAGNNILFVGISGPRGPSEEILIKKVSNNIYKISYFVKETGEYLVAIKWGDEHVNGSPYLVLTQ